MLKIETLKGFDSFPKAFGAGYKIYEKQAVASIVIRKSLENIGEESIKIGVSVAKKRAKRAVMRNRIKRLLRESLRLFLKNRNEKYGYCPIASIIISWKAIPLKRSLIGLKDVSSFVERSIDKAYQLFEESKKNETNSSDSIEVL